MVKFATAALALPILFGLVSAMPQKKPHVHIDYFDEAGCSGKHHRGSDKIKVNHCKTTKDFQSFQVSLPRGGHGVHLDGQYCHVEVFDQDKCKGESWTSGAWTSEENQQCNTHVFTKGKEARSVKLMCGPKPAVSVVTQTLLPPFGPTTIVWPLGPTEVTTTLVVKPSPTTLTLTSIFTPTGSQSAVVIVPQGPLSVQTNTFSVVAIPAKPITSTTTITIGAGKTTTTITIPASTGLTTMMIPNSDAATTMISSAIVAATTMIAPAIDSATTMIASAIDSATTMIAPAIDSATTIIGPEIDAATTIIGPAISSATNVVLPPLGAATANLVPAISLAKRDQADKTSIVIPATTVSVPGVGVINIPKPTTVVVNKEQASAATSILGKQMD